MQKILYQCLLRLWGLCSGYQPHHLISFLWNRLTQQTYNLVITGQLMLIFFDNLWVAISCPIKRNLINIFTSTWNECRLFTLNILWSCCLQQRKCSFFLNKHSTPFYCLSFSFNVHKPMSLLASIFTKYNNYTIIQSPNIYPLKAHVCVLRNRLDELCLFTLIH